MPKLPAQAMQLLKDMGHKVGGYVDSAKGVVAPAMDQVALGKALADQGNTLVNPSVGGAIGQGMSQVGKAAVPASVAGAAGLGAGAIAGAGAGNAAGYGQAQEEMAAQMSAEQEQKMAAAVQEMGKLGVLDPQTGQYSIKPGAVKKAIETVMGQGAGEGLTGEEYMQIAQMAGMTLDMSGG